MTLRLLALLTLLSSLFPPHAPLPTHTPQSRSPLTVFFVRHAETSGDTRGGGDPELSEAGRERAGALARLLRSSGATRLYSSEFARTRTTLGPLAEALGLEVEIVPAGEGARQLQALAGLEAGSVAVVAGHSNTVPAMVLGLGGEIEGLREHERYGPILEHHEYDRLFCVTLDAKTGRALSTVELGYGALCEEPAQER